MRFKDFFQQYILESVDLQIIPDNGDDIIIKGSGASLNLRIGNPDRWEGIWPDSTIDDIYEEKIAVISAIRVPKELWGQKIGTQLMLKVEQIVKDFNISTIYLKSSALMDGPDPTGFYEKMGYIIVDYTEDESPIMMKHIK